MVFDVEADGDDVVLHSSELEFNGYGSYNYLEDVSIYNENNVKVSRERDFDSSTEVISFLNNVVVKDG